VPKRAELAILLALLAFAAALRLYGLDWDDGQHLHPDERFIGFVQEAISWPEPAEQYFDTAQSPLNPYNRGFRGFAYGMLPLFAFKALTNWFGRSGLDGYTEVGRTASALTSLATVGLTYLLARELYGRLAAQLAAAILAFTVLDVQLAHFFAFDTFATCFSAGTLYLSCRLWRRDRLIYRLLIGLGLGCAIATKVSMLLLGPVVLLATVPGFRRRRRRSWLLAPIIPLSALLAFRLGEPYAFSGPGLLDLWPNPQRLQDLAYWVALSSGQVFAPFMIQWVDTPPYLFDLNSLVRWGFGPPAGLTALTGLALSWLTLRRFREKGPRILLIAWVTLNLLYFGGQFAKFMRYLLPIYPGLAVLAGDLLARLWRLGATWRRQPARPRRLASLLAAAAAPAVLVPTALWAVAFASIYSRPHTRVAASLWMAEQLPLGTTLAVEHWDDALPLPVDAAASKGFRQVTLQLYDEENDDKLARLLGELSRTEVIVLASNRLYGSIPRLPERYPIAIAYYRALFDGSLGFDLAAEFQSRPTLFDFAIDDRAAQEDFTVYDHPTVLVFRRAPRFELDRVAALLSAAERR
jgi:dolichyl-phosphate-mannose-protein mannosyltransferase